MNSTTQSSNIKKKNVKSLVFSGGGAWGFAYIGALKALENLGVLSSLTGIGGASAGSVTAFLVSCGYSSKEIMDLMSPTGKNSLIYMLLGEELPEIETIFDKNKSNFLEEIGEFFKDNFSHLTLPGLDVAAANTLCFNLALFAKEIMSERTAQLLRREFITHTTFRRNLTEGLGIFKAQIFRNFLNERMKKKMKGFAVKNPDLITFREHKTFFKKDLFITGTNLDTRKAELFSADTTPNFPVADAVRISMSIPFFFQPVIIQKDGENHIRIQIGLSGETCRLEWDNPLMDIESITGKWIDGGVEDNIPVFAFEKEQIFGLRVTPTHRPPGENRLSHFLFEYIFSRFWPDESHISKTWGVADRILLLDTGDVKPCEFDIDYKSERITNLLTKAEQRVLNYFH